ncbi:MAG: tRNA (adenosine(37)-N6)-threonylcarbamoyltransferase complex ATPase subunit type 1 TsaE [Bacteroidales bacterium]|nr:tRNA (adenosine(37)-N6)-threonylcarbamoyltransferase complex ATPase subunit type 1 TsaE [Bacteroidales bacterium]
MRTIAIPSLDQVDMAAEEFLKSSGEVAIIAFSGELGAGKTTFIQSICRVLGVTGEVNSPTFSLVNEYFTPDGTSVFHFDLYRIEGPDELFDMGYEEYFFSGDRCFIEWPEKASHLIPDDALRVEIRVLDDGNRELVF